MFKKACVITGLLLVTGNGFGQLYSVKLSQLSYLPPSACAHRLVPALTFPLVCKYTQALPGDSAIAPTVASSPYSLLKAQGPNAKKNTFTLALLNNDESQPNMYSRS